MFLHSPISKASRRRPHVIGILASPVRRVCQMRQSLLGLQAHPIIIRIGSYTDGVRNSWQTNMTTCLRQAATQSSTMLAALLVLMGIATAHLARGGPDSSLSLPHTSRRLRNTSRALRVLPYPLLHKDQSPWCCVHKGIQPAINQHLSNIMSRHAEPFECHQPAT